MEVNPYFCFPGRSWSLLDTHRSRSCAPTRQLRTHRGGGTGSPLPSTALQHPAPIPSKAELKPAKEQQIHHQPLSKPPAMHQQQFPTALSPHQLSPQSIGMDEI